jgi:hypothetical protein
VPFPTPFNSPPAANTGWTRPLLQAPYLLLAILGPIMQTVNMSQGVFFDPATMRPLVNNEGMRLALQTYANLTRFSSPEASNFCRPHNHLFTSGEWWIARGATSRQGQNRLWWVVDCLGSGKHCRELNST